jgi:hypothetical protein
MAIEFMCACGQVLRSNESRVGKKVRCPACWAIQLVPPPAAPQQMMAMEEVFEGTPDEAPAQSPQQQKYTSSAVFMTGVHDAVADSTDMMAPVRPNNKPQRPQAPPALVAPPQRMNDRSGLRMGQAPAKKPSSSAMPAQIRVESSDLGDTVSGIGEDTLTGAPGDATATQSPGGGTSAAGVMILLGGALALAAVLIYVFVGRT